MLNLAIGTVLSIDHFQPGAVEITVDVGGLQRKAMAFESLCTTPSVGDQVLLNTTAVDLELGTGGYHFIVSNLSNPVGSISQGPGHIMKLRYTPLQHSVLSVEEQDSPWREQIEHTTSLEEIPVVCCMLQSQIGLVAGAVDRVIGNDARVVYVMTGDAALAAGFSKYLWQLRDVGLIDAVITCDQAFGGDYEAVNIYTGLIAAKEVADADVIVVCQGPGNTGTDTRYGFSSAGQAHALHAAAALGGHPIAVTRISFADPRARHQAVSHHSLTVLGSLTLTRVTVAVPELPEDQMLIVNTMLGEACIFDKHDVRYADGSPGIEEVRARGVDVRVMGRTFEQDPYAFFAPGAAGIIAGEISCGKSCC